MQKVTRRRILVWGGIAAVVLVLIVLALRPQPVEVDTATVRRAGMEVTVDHEGKTRVRDRFVISAPVAGRLLRIELEPGDPVTADETVLASFRPGEPVPLDPRSRREAAASLEAARARLEEARARRQRTATEARRAAQELERTQDLADKGIVARDRLDDVQAGAEGAAEALAAADAAAAAARHEVAAARAALLEPQEPDEGSVRPVLSLRSPVDGVVLRRLRESSAVVPAGEPLLEVGDPRQLEIVSDYLSQDAVRIRAGMPVRVGRWGGDDELDGRVRRVEPHGYLKISALGVEEQRVDVVSDLTSPPQAWQTLGDGYRVETRVVVWSSDETLVVPTSALFRRGGSWSAFVVDDGTAHVRDVRVGRRNGLEAQVLDGLEPGDTVVVHPPDSIDDGSTVEARGG